MFLKCKFQGKNAGFLTMEFSGKNHKIASQSDSEKNQHVSFSKNWTLQEHDNSFNTLKDKFWYNVFEIMTSKLYITFFVKKKVPTCI